MAELARTLRSRLADLLGAPLVVAAHRRVHASVVPLEAVQQLLLERVAVAEKAVEGYGDALEKDRRALPPNSPRRRAGDAHTHLFLDAGTQLQLAERCLAQCLQEQAEVDRVARSIDAAAAAAQVHPSSPYARRSDLPSLLEEAGEEGTAGGGWRHEDADPQSQRDALDAKIEQNELRAAAQLSAEQDLRDVFDGLVEARRGLTELRPFADVPGRLPRARFSGAESAIEAAETAFAVAEWRCSKAPSLGDPSFLQAVNEAVVAVQDAQKALGVLAAALKLPASMTTGTGAALQRRDRPSPFGLHSRLQQYSRTSWATSSSRQSSRQSARRYGGTRDGNSGRRSSRSSRGASPFGRRMRSPKPLAVACRGLVPAVAAREARRLRARHRRQRPTAAGEEEDDDDDDGDIPPLFSLQDPAVRIILNGRSQSPQRNASPGAPTSPPRGGVVYEQRGGLNGEHPAPKVAADALRAYREIQTRMQHENQRKHADVQKRKARQAAIEKRRAEARAERKRQEKHRVAKFRWVRLKDKTLDVLRKKANRMGPIKEMIKLRFRRERMIEEDRFGRLLREAQKVVALATRQALETVWQTVGPDMERAGVPLPLSAASDVANVDNMASTAPLMAGEPRPPSAQIASLRRVRLVVAVLHCTPGPLAESGGDPGAATVPRMPRTHPLQQFFAGPQQHLTRSGDRRELVLVDFRCFDGHFPTGAERRRTHAYVLVGDVAPSETTPSLSGSLRDNPLASFVRFLVKQNECLVAMGTGHQLLARVCAGNGVAAAQLRVKRLPKWACGPHVEEDTRNRTRRRIFHALDTVFTRPPPGFLVTARVFLPSGSGAASSSTSSTSTSSSASSPASWIVGMSLGMNVMSVAGFPFLGPATFRESILRMRDSTRHLSSSTAATLSTVPTVPSVSVLCRRTDRAAAAAEIFAHLLRGGATKRVLKDTQIVACGCAARLPVGSLPAYTRALSEEGADTVAVGVCASRDGVAMAAVSPWLPNLIDPRTPKHQRIFGAHRARRDTQEADDNKDEVDAAGAANNDVGSVGELLRTSPWAVNMANWMDAAAAGRRVVPPSSVGPMNVSAMLSSSAGFVGSHTAGAMSGLARSCAGVWVRRQLPPSSSSSSSSKRTQRLPNGLAFDMRSPRSGADAAVLSTLAATLAGLKEHGCGSVWLVPVHGGVGRPAVTAQMLWRAVAESGYAGNVTLAAYDGELLRNARAGRWDWSFVRMVASSPPKPPSSPAPRRGFPPTLADLADPSLPDRDVDAVMEHCASLYDAVCVDKSWLLPNLRDTVDGRTSLSAPSRLVAAAHRVGLRMFARTFSARALPGAFSDRPSNEYVPYLVARVDGVVTTHPKHANTARRELAARLAARRKAQDAADTARRIAQEKAEAEARARREEEAERRAHLAKSGKRVPMGTRKEPRRPRQGGPRRFRPARPILRRTYRTAASPRATRGLKTRWVPRTDPPEYQEGILRISSKHKARMQSILRDAPTTSLGGRMSGVVSEDVFQFYSVLAKSCPNPRGPPPPDPLRDFMS